MKIRLPYCKLFHSDKFPGYFFIPYLHPAAINPCRPVGNIKFSHVFSCRCAILRNHSHLLPGNIQQGDTKKRWFFNEEAAMKQIYKRRGFRDERLEKIQVKSADGLLNCFWQPGIFWLLDNMNWW